MSFAAAFALIAQSAAPAVAIAPDTGGRGQVAERVSVSVQVLRPAFISASLEPDAEEIANAPAQRIQRSRDETGTVWIEFS